MTLIDPSALGGPDLGSSGDHVVNAGVVESLVWVSGGSKGAIEMHISSNGECGQPT